MKTIIDYALRKGPLANPDGSAEALVTDCKPVIGPGTTEIGNFSDALDFAPKGRIEAKLPYLPSLPKFCFRLVVKIGQTDSAQTLMTCPALGLNLSLETGISPTAPKLVANINNAQSGWSAATATVQAQKWILIDLAYDMDTFALFINQQLMGIAAFPVAQLAQSQHDKLTLSGRQNNPEKERFLGQVAALRLIDGIPENLENLLDAQRGTPNWNISLKANQTHPFVNLGQMVGNLQKDAKGGFFKQAFQKGMVFFDPADGQSAAIHGAIYELWNSKPALQAQLGNLLFDEMDARRSETRKSVFENGAIFWSSDIGAIPMVGKKMLADYVKIGEAASSVGLPKAAATTVPGGLRQQCQYGLLYFNEKAQKTTALRGSVATKYTTEGGHVKWGMPVSNTTNIWVGSGEDRESLGTLTELEKNAAIFQERGEGAAYLLYGDILDKYLSEAVGGPAGTLGFPKSDVKTFGTSTKHVAFERGAIVQIGNETIAVPTFNIRVKRVETEDSEGVDSLQDQNDLYMYFVVRENGHEVYKKRYPESGDVSKNIVEPNFSTQKFNPANAYLKLELELDVNEADYWGDDDLGVFKKELRLDNAWGLLDDDLGVFNSGKISKIKNIVWAVVPETNERTPYDFWETGNKSTPVISEQQYAAAFYDVDPEPDWYSPVDWLKRAFYEIVKGVAKTGNCHGFCTEAIYAWKERSILGRPLGRFDDFKRVEHEINIRHCSQLGAESLGWVIGLFAKNNMHDPKTVFKETRNFFNTGTNPVICISTDWKFGDGHVLLPIAWDDSKSVWEITVFDPNNKNEKQVIKIDPVKNTFKYKTKYEGGAGLDNLSKGYLYYMPWSVLDSIPYTPISGLPQLGMAIITSLVSGTLGILGSDGQNLFANQSPESMAGNMDGKFLLVPKLDGQTNGELLINTAQSSLKTPTNFDHALKGSSDGALEYALVWKRQAFKLGSTIAKSEQNTIGMKQLGTPQQLATLQSPKNKLMSLTTGQKLGFGKDFMRIEVNQIPVKAGLTTQLNIQPNGNSIDILSSAEAVDAQVIVSGQTDGKAFRQEYETRLEGGTRLLFSHARSSNLLKTGKIDNVFGAMRSSTFVKKR